MLKHHKACAPAGIFLGDASSLFVPDNEHYEGSVRLLFDEYDPPGRAEGADRGAARALSVAAVRHAGLARAHQPAGGLLSVHRRGGRLRQGARMPGPVPAGGGRCRRRGEGVMKRLVTDRGFLDGAQIGRGTREHGIDILIPARKGMDIARMRWGCCGAVCAPVCPGIHEAAADVGRGSPQEAPGENEAPPASAGARAHPHSSTLSTPTIPSDPIHNIRPPCAGRSMSALPICHRIRLSEHSLATPQVPRQLRPIRRPPLRRFKSPGARRPCPLLSESQNPEHFA